MTAFTDPYLMRGKDDEGLTDLQVRRTRNRREHACWYYFGREDALDRETPRDDRRRHDSWGFAKFASAEARAYERGAVSWLASIQDQYERYTTAPKDSPAQPYTTREQQEHTA